MSLFDISYRISCLVGYRIQIQASNPILLYIDIDDFDIFVWFIHLTGLHVLYSVHNFQAR